MFSHATTRLQIELVEIPNLEAPFDIVRHESRFATVEEYGWPFGYNSTTVPGQFELGAVNWGLVLVDASLAILFACCATKLLQLALGLCGKSSR